jgi:hypothetical protein
VASKLGTWLGTLGPERLAEILTRRPDAAYQPLPRNLSELAERLQNRMSVAAAFNGLPRPAVQLIEAMQAFGGPTVSRARLADAVGRTVDDPDLSATLEVLELRGLVWPDGDELRMAGPLWSIVRFPLHLGPPAERLYAARTAAEVRRFSAALGVPTEKSKQRQVEELARWVRDGEQVRRAVAVAPVDVRALLHQVAWEGPLVAVPDVLFGYGHSTDPILNWALERGMLVTDGWQAAVMPGEIGMALRGPDWRAPFTPYPPDPPLVDADPEAVAQEAAAAAGPAIAQASALLEACAATPVILLRAGGVGTRELRRLARTVGCDERLSRLWLELAYLAGLLGSGPSSGEARHLLPSEAYDAWCTADPADRLVPLLRAWWRLPAAPFAPSGPDGGSSSALTYHMTGDNVAELRRELLRAVADLPAGRGVAAGSSAALAEIVTWRAPMLMDAFADPATLVAALWREAEVLGICAHGTLTELGRALLFDSPALREVAAALLPAAVTTALFQADLSAVVPGTPTSELARLLDSAADREPGSGTGAAIWRFSAASVRRSFDSGQTTTSLLDALRAVAAGGTLPQPLEYLVGDVARRHGLVRVRNVASVVRADDPALLAEIAAVRSLASLKLTPLAPTVLASAASAAETLAALRAAGYAPVGESSGGDVVIERAAQKRAPRSRPVPGTRRGTVPASAAVDLPALAAALLSSDPEPARRHLSLVESPGIEEPDLGALVALAAPQLNRAEQRLLVDAVEHSAMVRIDYTNAQGSPSTRVIEPLALQGHLLEAWCHLRDEERMFALNRIEAVAPA